MYCTEIFKLQPKLAQLQEIKVYAEESMSEMGRNVLPHVNDKPIPLLLLGIAISYQMISSVPTSNLFVTLFSHGSTQIVAKMIFSMSRFISPYLNGHERWKSIFSCTVPTKMSKFKC